MSAAFCPDRNTAPVPLKTSTGRIEDIALLEETAPKERNRVGKPENQSDHPVKSQLFRGIYHFH